MRIFYALPLLLLPWELLGQPLPAKFYLNSEQISLEKTFIFPQNIESIKFDRSSDTGKVFIITKKIPWQYKSLQGLIIDSYDHLFDSIFTDKSLTRIYNIDDHIIDYPLDIRIDLSYFCELTTIDLSDSKLLDETCRKIVIINIKLTNKKPEPTIFIRGKVSKDLELIKK
jgi:hypothetical protein